MVVAGPEGVCSVGLGVVLVLAGAEEKLKEGFSAGFWVREGNPVEDFGSVEVEVG